MGATRSFTVAALAACALAACHKSTAPAASDAGAAVADASSDAGDAQVTSGALDAGPPPDQLALPQPSSDELLARMRHLVEAIAQDNSELARDVLLPREAYGALKDAPDPEKAWDKKLEPAFRKAVERTHAQTKGVERARFVSFELGHTVVQSPPKKHDMKQAVWRAKHSKLVFSVDGKTHALVIPEMMAWRGAWYVTRLR